MTAVTRSVLIRIAERDGDWPISLHVDDGREGWLGEPAASAVIPGPLPAPPVTVPEAEGGQEAIRAFLLGTADESTAFEQIGAYLHGLLSRGDVGARWQTEAKDAQAGNRALRVLLELPESLATLPWELMCVGTNWLATDVSSPLVRVGRGFPGDAERRPVRWPLRVLVVVGSQEDDRVVAAEQEVDNLDDAFRRMCGQVDVEFLKQPSREEVTATFLAMRPHIFHFIGHGSVHAGRGRLALYDPTVKDNVAWTAPDIQMDLRGWQPRLAILNACRSVRVDQQNGAWGVADAFAALGVPAVIAMQADIRGDSAATFTGELYSALARHEPLDVAVASGRRAIARDTGLDQRDYALPSLTVSAPPESVLRMRFGVSDEHRPHVERLHRNFPAFVDRTRERRRLWRDLEPDPEPEERAPGTRLADAIAIVGNAKVGKSELARWCVGGCELHGGNAAYVDLGRGNRLDAVSALEVIALALEGSAVHASRNQLAFARWRSLAAEQLPDGAGPPPPDALPNTFTYFQDALREAAAGQPLLVALDDLGALPPEELELVCDLLLEPIAAHRLPPVRVILVLSEEQSVRLTEGLQRAMDSPIVLTSFKPDKFKYIAGQYLRYHFKIPAKDLADQLESLPRMKDEFSWKQVKGLKDFLQSAGWSSF
jgi:hypothetical protein